MSKNKEKWSINYDYGMNVLKAACATAMILPGIAGSAGLFQEIGRNTSPLSGLMGGTPRIGAVNPGEAAANMVVAGLNVLFHTANQLYKLNPISIGGAIGLATLEVIDRSVGHKFRAEKKQPVASMDPPTRRDKRAPSM